jgi:predicted transcriptional regulator
VENVVGVGKIKTACQNGTPADNKMMSAVEIIQQIKELPYVERARVARFVVEEDDSWIPDEFKEAMQDAEAGRLVDMKTALRETPPTRLQ